MPKEQEETKLQGTPAFPDLPYNDPDGDEEGAKKGEEDKLTELQKQIEAQNAAIEALKAQNFTLMAQPLTAQVQKPTPPAPKPDLSGLPNPVDDPDGYAAGVSERTIAHIEATRGYEAALAQEEGKKAGRVEQLWDDFQTLHEDYAANPTRVKFIAGEVAARAAARGIDVERYMFTHSDKFMADVAAAYDKEFGKPKRAGEAEAGAEETITEATRTGGAFGGIETGGRVVDRGDKQRADTMFADIRDFQKKHGFY